MGFGERNKGLVKLKAVAVQKVLQPLGKVFLGARHVKSYLSREAEEVVTSG